jgi:hypothetical protein
VKIWVSLPGTAFCAVSEADILAPVWFIDVPLVIFVPCPSAIDVVDPRPIPIDSINSADTTTNFFILPISYDILNIFPVDHDIKGHPCSSFLIGILKRENQALKWKEPRFVKRVTI